MKRDLDRIREILLEIEGAEPLQELRYSGDIDCHQIQLLEDAGFVKAEIYEDSEGISAEVERMTSQGYDFLDSIRNATIWEKVKERVRSTVGSVSLSVLSDVAITIVKRKVGIDWADERRDCVHRVNDQADGIRDGYEYRCKRLVEDRQDHQLVDGRMGGVYCDWRGFVE